MDAQICARPGCDELLTHGKTYCSNHCSAVDRQRVKHINKQETALSGDARALIPKPMREFAFTRLGDGATVFLEEIAITLAEEKAIPAPPLLSKRTEPGYGQVDQFGVLRLSSGKNYRPNDLLSFPTIDDMTRNGSVLFALELKKAYIRSVLRNERSWKVNCQDERMRKVVRGIMMRLLLRHANELLESIPYGCAFFEKEWDYQPSSFWGLEEGLRGKFYGLRSIKAIHPSSIDHIRYKDNGHTFNGFVQNAQNVSTIRREIPVPVDLALIQTYNQKWRNLWGNPATDPMYPLWFWLEIALRSFLRYLERTGTPVTVAWAPSKGQVTMPDGTKMANMKAAQLMAGYAAKSNAIAIPSDVDEDTKQRLWGLEYLSDDKRGEMFVRAIELLGTMLTRAAIMGDRMATQDSRVGSNAASQTHLAVTQMHNELILDEQIRQINDYMVTPIVDYNGSTRTPRAWIETEGLDPVERDNLFKLIGIVGNQADSFAMKRIDWESVFAVNNIPFLTKEEAEELVKDELKRTEKHNAMMMKSAEKGAPAPKKPQQQKVKASGDYLMWQLANGARVPIILTPAQARGIVDRLADRPTVVDMHIELEDNFDAQVDQIVEEIMLELDEDIDPETRAKVRQYVLAQLGLAERGQEFEYIEFDAIELSKVGDFLKRLYKKAKSFINKAVKRVTGQTASAWLAGKRPEKGKYKVKTGFTKIITKTGIVWDPAEHPRDADGKFTEKGAGEASEKAVPGGSKIAALEKQFAPEKWIGADPDKGIAGEIEVDGMQYRVVGDKVDPALMAKVHKINLSIHERAAELGYPLEKVPLQIMQMEDKEAFTKYMRDQQGYEIPQELIDEYYEKTGGAMAIYDFDKTMKIDAKLAREDPEAFEISLLHETLHGQPDKNGDDRGFWRTIEYTPDEIFTVLVTAQYSEEYGLPVLNGYPIWTSWIVKAADNLGWDKEKLYAYAQEAHKADGSNKTYAPFVTELLAEAGLGEPWKDNEKYFDVLDKYHPGWEEAWKSIAELYGLDPEEWLAKRKGE